MFYPSGTGDFNVPRNGCMLRKRAMGQLHCSASITNGSLIAPSYPSTYGKQSISAWFKRDPRQPKCCKSRHLKPIIHKIYEKTALVKRRFVKPIHASFSRSIIENRTSRLPLPIARWRSTHSGKCRNGSRSHRRLHRRPSRRLYPDMITRARSAIAASTSAALFPPILSG